MHRYFSLLLLVVFASAGALLTNGDFEQDLGVGWQQLSSGSNVTINRGTAYDPDPDYEVFLEKGTGSGYAKLMQIVSIPTTDLEFAIDAKLYSYDNNEDTLCWAGAAVIVAYLDESGSLLGCTQICSHTEPCPWENSSTMHLMEIQDTMWHDFAFNIDYELDYLPGITPSEIAKIAVVLFDTTDHTC